MQGLTLAAFGALLAAAAAAVVLGTRHPEPRQSAAPRQSADTAPEAVTSADPAPADPAADPPAGAPSDGNAFDRLPNGKPVPTLPSSAPESVTFGVIQFPYRGAELAPKGSPSKSEALAEARSALAAAKKDFDKAVRLGDSGSTTDAGSVPRGVLEPSVQYVLFTLAKGQICAQPVDTPRGYWVVRRNE
jgi:PPIC-type PPIASE domain